MNKKQKMYGRPVFGGRVIGSVLILILILILHQRGLQVTGEPNESGLGILFGFGLGISLITGKLRVG